MSPKVQTRGEIITLISRIADEYKIPRVLLWACCIAESNLNPRARRPSEASQDNRFWPDVSGGLCQQIVLYDPDYHGGTAYPGPAEVERILNLQYDPERSLRVAAANLSQKFHDGSETDDDDNLSRDLYEYNWPAGKERPYSQAHIDNYRRGLREARQIVGNESMVDTVAEIQKRVIELGKTQIGKPYSGPIVGQPDSYRWGDPGWDCSSFVSGMYSKATNGAIKLVGFTDAAYGQCEWMQTPQAGDIVYYHYDDASQPNVKFPHMGIWLSPTEVLDCRYSDTPGKGGVGIRPHVTPISDGQGRYRVTMRPKGLANVVLPTPTPVPIPAPTPTNGELDAANKRIVELIGERDRLIHEKNGLVEALSYVGDDVMDAIQANLETVRRVRKERVGVRP